MLSLPYSWLERLRRLVDAHGGRILQEEFAEDIMLVARFPAERLPGFEDAVRHSSNDRLKSVVVSQEEELVPVV
jgi:hypothetical protein